MKKLNALLLLVVLSLSMCALGQGVTADYNNHDGSDPIIHQNVFGINGGGSSLKDAKSLTTLHGIGVTQTRFWVQFYTIFSKGVADFSTMDVNLDRMKAAGLTPMPVLNGTPPSIGTSNCAVPDTAKWSIFAAQVVAHINAKYPGMVVDYEIWSEPDTQAALCPAANTDAARLSAYLSLYSAAASAMHAQALADHQPIRTGGPALASPGSNLTTWITGLVNNPATAPYVDFVSMHIYETGQWNIDNNMDWNSLYSITQSSTVGLASFVSAANVIIRKGAQPNAATTQLYITEYNDNWAYALDCCRSSQTYAPLWNATAFVDLLQFPNVAKLFYFSGNNSGTYFCIMGTIDVRMQCYSYPIVPYPQFYAFQLFASTLGLQYGGNLATSVTANSGLLTSAFYTPTADELVLINPTSSPMTTPVTFNNVGLANVTVNGYLLNKDNPTISPWTISVAPVPYGYTTQIIVPAYSTMAVALRGVVIVPSGTLTVVQITPLAGHTVQIDTPAADNGSPVVGRTVSFGDNQWESWNAHVTHSYAKAGKYTVTVVLRNATGQLSTQSTTVTVQ
jgi:PKD repeat protein